MTSSKLALSIKESPPACANGDFIDCLVDPRRLELLTSSMPWKRSSQLNYGPVKRRKYTQRRKEIKTIFASGATRFPTSPMLRKNSVRTGLSAT